MSDIPRITEALLHVDDNKLADFLMVEYAKNEMLIKLSKKRLDGKGDWHHPTKCNNEHLLRSLINHVSKGDMVDVLNIAAMILLRNQLYGEKTLITGDL